MNTPNLLVELFVEELPPKALGKLGIAFADNIYHTLATLDLVEKIELELGLFPSPWNWFASPRRLGVYIRNVRFKAADKPVSHKLMPVSVGLDANGQPTPALLKRLAGMSLDASVVPSLKREGDGKAEALYMDTVVTGATLAEGLQKALEEAIAKLPIPKVMTYQLQDGRSTVKFVRPAHGLVALHGSEVVQVSILGLHAGRTTQGHRFEATAHPVVIKDADSYESQMENEGAVIPSFEKRRDVISRQLTNMASGGALSEEIQRQQADFDEKQEGTAFAAAMGAGALKPIEDDALLDEVTALVERPNVLVCQFEKEFLEVPQECLILTMKANQKYFPLLDAAGKLTNRFLIVSNIRPADASAVIGGNERVVRPRLADAKFFFDQDRKKPLASRVEKLGSVVYHNKLGTQLERVQRVTKLAGEIARKLGADAAQAERAAHLAKADLLTDMVGEFPELQGIMGRYYAAHDGEPEAVSRAVEQHYQPRFAGDALPEDNIGAAVALADKLETLVGIYGIGLVPTGDKDPFALRRHALGVLRILAEKELPLDLLQLLQFARSLYPAEMVSDSVAVDVHGFMLERLKNYLKDAGFANDEVEAVASQNPTRIDLVTPRLEAVREFKKLPEAEALAAANKRIQNILKKTEVPAGAPDAALFQEAAEKALFDAVNRLAPGVESLVANRGYTEALTTLAGVRAEVDAFFDQVMVMADEMSVRNNRLALLRSLAELMNGVADISKLAG